MKSEIGECVSVIHEKLWSKTIVKNQLKSQSWWKRRLDALINSPSIEIEKTPDPIIEIPIPFEIEMNMPELNYEILIKAWKKIKHK